MNDGTFDQINDPDQIIMIHATAIDWIRSSSYVANVDNAVEKKSNTNARTGYV